MRLKQIKDFEGCNHYSQFLAKGDLSFTNKLHKNPNNDLSIKIKQMQKF